MEARTRRGCAVCGGHEIESDEVLDGSVLRLAQCLRCRHRWTERPPWLARVPGREGREVAVAA